MKKNVSCPGRADGSIDIISTGFQGPFKYHWSHNNTASGPSIAKLKAGDYMVTISYGSCQVVKVVRITEPNKMKIQILPIAMQTDFLGCGIKPNVTFKLKAFVQGGTGHVNTSFGATNIRNVSSPVNIICVAVDSTGCSSSAHYSSEEGVVHCSRDPNDITGPTGLDSARWVSIKDELLYKVRFENDPVFATTNASSVLIEVPLDDEIDVFSTRITSFGFGSNLYEIPINTNVYQKRIDLVAQRGIYVDVIAGLNITENKMFWKFETIDPLTGQSPINPFMGFLPVNDSITGSGEGFVTFTARIKTTSATGETIDKKAAIIFDNNEALETNVWSNKIDAFPPVSYLEELPDTSLVDTIQLCWNGADDLGGVGVKSVRIQASENGGPVFTIVEEWVDSCFNFRGQPGSKYKFKVQAIDLTGNEEIKAIFEDSCVIQARRNFVFVSPINLHTCPRDTVVIDGYVTSIDSVGIYISNDNGINYSLLQKSSTAEFPIPFYVSEQNSGDTMVIQIRDLHSNFVKTSQSIEVKPLPGVNAGPDLEVCSDEYITLFAEGANDYFWQPIENMGTPFEPITNVYTDSLLWVTLSGIDINGCKNVDTMTVFVYSTSIDTAEVGLCEGDSIFINGNWVNTSGYYPAVYLNVNNCDSVIVTHVYFQNPCIWNGGSHVFVDKDATGANNGLDWENALTDLQEAIYIAGRYENVQEIWVAEGRYQPSVEDRDTSFVLRDSIKIYGGFVGTESDKSDRTLGAEAVKLSGDIGLPTQSNDNSKHVVLGHQTCAECVLDRVTIEYGYADENLNNHDKGAGILNFGNLKLTNTILERNHATNEGAAILALNNEALMNIHNCVFRLNTSVLGRDVLFRDGAIIEFEGFNQIQE
ncbi:MAG: SprB repeat-containing protein [Saprospiraceae bacterium]|nr:SprB repeat-containing protein [Saprospiraceae bacterium]